MTVHFLIFSIALLFSVSVPAELKNFMISGASGYAQDTTTSRWVLYGGLAGSTSSCTMDGFNPCNNCAGVVTPCNERRIYSNLNLRFDFIPTMGGQTMIANDLGIITGITKAVATANQSTYVSIQWSALCQALGSNSDCSTALTKNLISVGVDKDGDSKLDEKMDIYVVTQGVDAATKTFHSNCPTDAAASNEGVCHFSVVAGDRKVYVLNENLNAPLSTYPATGTNLVKYKAVRFYYVTGASGDISAFEGLSLASPYSEMKINVASNPFTLESNTISNLENGTTYFFRMANVDEAGNVFYFSRTPGEATSSALATLNLTEHSMTPGEVVGAFDELRCFIATAAYGSPYTQELMVFRAFRDQFLRTHFLGKKFIEAYYAVSPPLAEQISKSDMLRFLVRGVLEPVYWFCKLILEYHGIGLFIFCCLFICGLLTLLFVRNWVVRKIKAKKFLRSGVAVVILFTSLFGSLFFSLSVMGAADKDLVEVTEEGAHIYNTKQSEREGSFGFRVGALRPLETESSGGVTFKQVYGESSMPALLVDYSQDLSRAAGLISAKLSFGFAQKTGSGRFKQSKAEAYEKYSFLEIPMILSLGWRGEFWDSQFLIPYVDGGLAYIGLAEMREDNKGSKIGGALGGSVGAGLLLSITAFDRGSASMLDSEYGINNFFLAVEMRQINASKNGINLSSSFINAGILVDY